MTLILYVIAFVCFIGAAAGAPSRVNLTAVGLAVWLLADKLLAAIPGV